MRKSVSCFVPIQRPLTFIFYMRLPFFDGAAFPLQEFHSPLLVLQKTAMQKTMPFIAIFVGNCKLMSKVQLIFHAISQPASCAKNEQSPQNALCRIAFTFYYTCQYKIHSRSFVQTTEIETLGVPLGQNNRSHLILQLYLPTCYSPRIIIILCFFKNIIIELNLFMGTI